MIARDIDLGQRVDRRWGASGRGRAFAAASPAAEDRRSIAGACHERDAEQRDGEERGERDARRAVMAPMVEPVADEEPPMPLTLASPIVEIDAKIATRTGRARSKGATVKEAWEVLATPSTIETVGELAASLPAPLHRPVARADDPRR